MGGGVEGGIEVGDGMDGAVGAGVVTGMRAGVCVGSGICSSLSVQVWALVSIH
jgi:hypothetical protein